MSRWWWEQDDIDSEGTKKRAAEVVTVLDSDSYWDADPGREEESSGASGLIGAEWSGAEE